MKKEIQEVLERFGLRETDQRVYLAMLSMGAVTLSPIARQTGLPVTTVQSVVRRLVDVGIVSATKRKSRSVFEADDPAVLRRIL